MARIMQTIVFECDNQEQRKALLDQFSDMILSDECPRVVGLSVDNELTRASLMAEALERHDDHYDLRQAIEALYGAINLENWSWEKYEADSA